MTSLNSNGNFLSDHLFSLSYGLRNSTKINQSSFQVDRNALLFYAIRNNNFDIVYYLMNYAKKNNINMNIIDSHGTTPLHFAYKNNFGKILEYLLSVLNINQKDRNGNTLLHCTIEDNNIKWMTKLIHLGANVNSINYYGNSILDGAIAKGDFNLLMQLLKSNRLRIQGFNERGYTPIISVLLSKKFNLKNKEIIITQFINKGTNLNIVGEDNKTPISYALKYKYANIISLLINNGANINVLEFKNNDITFTNLQDLIENNQLDIIKLVLDHNLNININMQNESNGNTLL
ncbi:ankyrin repeat-containing domain protein, partial [Neocallimastix sp. 'constans']